MAASPFEAFLSPGSAAAPWGAALVLAAASVTSLAVVWWAWTRPGLGTKGGAEQCAQKEAWQHSYTDPLRWAFLPSGKPNRANSDHPEVFESEFATVKVISMHRPTHESWREETGHYPFSWHLSGRKRLWEIRIQLVFKKVPSTKMYFGISFAEYMPVSRLMRQMQKVLVKACNHVVGDIYHSPGDDPSCTSGELEPPTAVMPLWAFDQFIVSEPGEEPHLWGSLEGLGMRRTDGLVAYAKAVRSMTENFSTGKVYTLSCWGVSQFFDCMNWQVCGGILPGVRMDFSKLGGSAPVYVAMYEMPKVREGDADQRHLPSRRQCYFHVAMWSELQPPKPEILERLSGKCKPPEVPEVPRARKPQRRSLALADSLPLWLCCSPRDLEVMY